MIAALALCVGLFLGFIIGFSIFRALAVYNSAKKQEETKVKQKIWRALK